MQTISSPIHTNNNNRRWFTTSVKQAYWTPIMFSKDGGTTSDHIYILIKYLLLHEKYVAMSNNKNTSVTITEQEWTEQNAGIYCGYIR